MKLKLFFYLIYLSSCMLSNLFAQAVAVNENLNSSNPKEISPLSFEPISDIIRDSLLELFFTQPQYTRSSFKYFLTNIFNHNKYASQFLSFNFSHIFTFLNFNIQSEVPRDYICRVIGLFTQKLKSTAYVNGHCFAEFIKDLPNMLKAYTKPEDVEKNKIDKIRHCIYTYLLRDFKTLKENPDEALDQLAVQVYYALESKNNNADATLSKLQLELLIFLEITINKLIWATDEQDQLDIWLSIKSIGQDLENLRIINAIETDDQLDSLYWSLISRFSYFLELSGNELKLEFYNAVNNDLNSQNMSLWMLKERESYITTKLEYLKYNLLSAEVRARSVQAGIIADRISTTA